MSKSNHSIWFWQTMLTPHMGALAAALAELGYNVNFVANEILSEERIKLGWKKAELGKAKFKLVKNKNAVISLAKKVPKNSVHFYQGLRGNGLVSEAQKILQKCDVRHWVVLEKVDDKGWRGKLRGILYHILFLYWRKYLEGVLAIGYRNKEWIVERGIKENLVYPFAYFLKIPKINEQKIKFRKTIKKSPYRFIFVGLLSSRKKIDLLINAIAALKLRKIELWIIGDGPNKTKLHYLANLLLPGRVYWFGSLPMSKIPIMIRAADCLVLPSEHDGWGAVTSEALMVGIPVICSNACGSSIVVKASGVGGIFLCNNQKSLTRILLKQYKEGTFSIKKKN